METLLHDFWNDSRVQIVLLLIILDLGLGVIAAALSKTQAFRLSFVADFLRNDVLGKVLPFFLLYGGYVYASGADIVIPGLDMEVIMDGAWVVVLAALVGSLLGSLKDLGLLGNTADEIAGPDPTSPAVPPSSPDPVTP